MNRVGNSAEFQLVTNRVKVQFGNRAAHLHPIFLGARPPDLCYCCYLKCLCLQHLLYKVKEGCDYNLLKTVVIKVCSNSFPVSKQKLRNVVVVPVILSHNRTPGTISMNQTPKCQAFKLFCLPAHCQVV